MKKVLLGLVIANLIVACSAKPVFVKVDETMVKELPKEVALKYLFEVIKTPSNQIGEFSCLIEKYGLRRDNIPSGTMQIRAVSAPWQNLKFNVWAYNERECVVSVSFPEPGKTSFSSSFASRLDYCSLVVAKKAHLKNKDTAPDYQKLCYKTVTALRSMGAKAETEK